MATNSHPFKVNQRVVYVMQTLPDVGLINNKIYTVQSVAACSCGQCIDVGIMLVDKCMTACYVCGEIINLDDSWFFHHSGFRALAEASNERCIEENLTRLAAGSSE